MYDVLHKKPVTNLMMQLKRPFLWLVLLTVIITIWLYVFHSNNTKPGINTKNSFVDLNKHGVMTFHNVCIEMSRVPVSHTIQFKNSARSFSETLRIVIYNYNTSSRSTLSVSGSANSIWNEWDVIFNDSQIPKHYNWHRNKAAYFISPTCPGNLHHFWEDEFRGLQSVVAASHRLDPVVKNQLIYRIPWDLEPDEFDCYNVKVFEQFLFLLNFETSHDVFYKLPPNTCYDHAVFGLADFSSTKRQASDHILQKLAVDYGDCPSNRVTIIQRTYRRILNIHNLVNITQAEGFIDVNVVKFEELTFEEQVRTAACSTILVGVQGAGLQWAIFMRPGSTLIEIAWPKKFWKFYFNAYVPAYNIYHRGVLANNLRVNWPAYQNKVRGGKVVPAEERILLMTTKPKSPDLDNIWKWADAIVEEKHYMFALRSHKYANAIKYHR